MEKRAGRRLKCEASITCSCFNKDEIFNAKMLNYSPDGMYFESKFLLKERTNILFKVKDLRLDRSDPKHCEGLRTVSLAEVKWWKDMGDKTAANFGIGVKYY